MHKMTDLFIYALFSEVDFFLDIFALCNVCIICGHKLHKVFLLCLLRISDLCPWHMTRIL